MRMLMQEKQSQKYELEAQKLADINFVKGLASYSFADQNKQIIHGGIVIVLDERNEYFYVGQSGGKSSISRKPSYLFLRNDETRQVSKLCRQAKIETFYLYPTTQHGAKIIVPMVKAIIGKNKFDLKSSGVKPKFSFVKDEDVIDPVFEVNGFIRYAKTQRKYAYIGTHRFSQAQLKKFGVLNRNLFVSLRVERRASKEWPNDYLVILEHINPDLRTLSDMRLKPAWRKLPWLIPAIDAIYAERDLLTRQTGIPHEVDHIMPIKSHLCCGLTVPWNLQVISAVENRRKSNKIQS